MKDLKDCIKNMSLNKKKEILELLNAKKRIESDKILQNWCPSLLQEHFLLNTKKIRVIGGATRSGKSDAAATDISIRSTGIIPDILKDRYPTNRIRKGDYWCSGLDFNAGRDVVYPKLDSFIAQRFKIGYNKADRIFTLIDKVHIGQKSADSGREKYGGTSRNGIWMDEEHPKEIWDECYDRTSDCEGYLTMTFLPVKGLTWAYSELYCKAFCYVSTVNIHGMEEKEGLVHTVDDIEKLKERKIVIRYNTSSNADPDIVFYEMSVYDNCYIPSVEIYKREKKYKDDPSGYRARVLGRFTKITGANVFNVPILLKKQAECIKPFKRGDIKDRRFVEHPQGKLIIFKDLKKLHNYHFAIGADTSEGLDTGDASCAQIVSYATHEQWAMWHGKPTPEEFAGILVELGMFFNYAWVAPERNFHGFGVVSRIRDHFKYRRLYSEYDISQHILNVSVKPTEKRYGWDTNTKTKPIMIQDLASDISQGSLRINDFHTYEELITYVYKTNRKTGALGGCKDDRVTALAIANQVLKRKGIPRTKITSSFKPKHIVDPITGY